MNGESDRGRPTGPYPRYNGMVLPPLPKFVKDVEGAMDSIRKFECREDDVLLCTFPKSGTNWVHEILYMLMTGKTEYAPESKSESWIDFKPLENFASLPSPRLLNTHVPYRYLPEQHRNKNIKIVHIIRNPKDAAVSMYCHLSVAISLNNNSDGYPGTWDNYIGKVISGELNLYSGWCKYEKEFEKAAQENDNIFTAYYEDMKRNPQKEIERLAEFLEVPYTEKLISKISDMTQFSKLKAAVDKMKRDEGVVKNTVDGSNYLYRKGVVGDWKNWFTFQQNELFDKMLLKEIKNSNIRMIFDG